MSTTPIRPEISQYTNICCFTAADEVAKVKALIMIKGLDSVSTNYRFSSWAANDDGLFISMNNPSNLSKETLLEIEGMIRKSALELSDNITKQTDRNNDYCGYSYYGVAD